jgi:hypothetical protein
MADDAQSWFAMRGRQLEWYRFFVHNRSAAGSLFTLLHVPFMLSFLAMVFIGLLPVDQVDVPVLLMSLAAVALLIYGEHLLDDTTRVGKPWATVLKDRTLFAVASIAFLGALSLGVYASWRYGTVLPTIGIVLGIGFSVLYGLEVWRFHSMAFGAIGMGAVAGFSYLAQALATSAPLDLLMALLLVLAGTGLAYVLLELYEHTKTSEYRFAWRALAVHFATIYALAALVAYFSL